MALFQRLEWGPPTDRKLMTSVPVPTMHENVHQWASEKHQERQVLEGVNRMAGQQVGDRRQHDRNDDSAQDGCSVDGPPSKGDIFDQPRPISVCTHDRNLQKP